MATHRMSIGRLGEDIAARFLQRRGATVLARNVRVGRDEIDLVVAIEGERIAVEVKTATGSDARPEENFDPAKEQHVRRAVGSLTPPIHRIDLVTVVLDGAGATVRWLPEAG